MSASVALPGSSPVAIPVREIAPWIVFGVVMLLALYFTKLVNIHFFYVHQIVIFGLLFYFARR